MRWACTDLTCIFQQVSPVKLLQKNDSRIISCSAEDPAIKKREQPKFRSNPACKYIAFYKPFEVLCQFTREKCSEKRTLAEFDFPKDVYAVGRLDFDSEGLLILSDDPRINGALLDPKHGHARTYLAQVERVPEPEALSTISNGVIIEGRKTLPARVRLILDEPDLPARTPPIRFRKNIPTAWLEIALSEGKNRQVRKMTAAIGHPTLRLVRVAIGTLELRNLDLEPGWWRELGQNEVELLFSV